MCVALSGKNNRVEEMFLAQQLELLIDGVDGQEVIHQSMKAKMFMF